MSEIQPAILQLLKNIYPFSDLDSKNFNLLLPYLEQCTVPAGEQIFNPGQWADAFYFILAGNVEITLTRNKTSQSLLSLLPYDHFGEDAFLHQKRKTGSVAHTQVTLLKISTEHLERVCNESPLIKRIFHMFAQSYQNYCRTQFNWREPVETTYLQLRKHPIFLWSKLAPILLISIFLFGVLLFKAFTIPQGAILWVVLAFLALGIGVLVGIWELLAWTNQYFVLTKERILIQKLLVGVFESRQEAPMSAVLSIGLDTSFLGRMIGYGTVTARAYTGNMIISQFPDADLIYAYLEHRRKSILADQHRHEQENMHQLLESRFYPERTSTAPAAESGADIPTNVNYYSDSISDLIARFFTLRLEKEGAIIYRTHWWILLKKLFLPSLFLACVVVMTLARVFAMFNVDSTLVYGLAIIAALAGWGWWFYEYADWRLDVYIITADQLIDVNVHPLGKEDKRSAPVKNIQTVEYKRNGIIGMALNFGTVRIQIGNEELTFNNVYNPSAIQVEIFNRFREFGERSRKMEQKHMTDWFSTYDGIRHEGENGS